MPIAMCSSQEPDVEYSRVAFTVVSDDVTLPDLYEDAHECYIDPDELDEVSRDEVRLDETRFDAFFLDEVPLDGPPFEAGSPARAAVKIVKP